MRESLATQIPLFPIASFFLLESRALESISQDLIASFSANQFFLLSFSRPPGGYVKTKKLLHTLTAILVDRAGFEPAAFRSSQAERLCEPNVLRPDIRQYTRLNYRPQKLAFHKPILRLWRATAPNRFRKMLIPVQAPAEKTSGPVAQHGYVARSNAKEHTTDNRGVVNPDDVQSTEFKSLRAHHKPTYNFTPISANAGSNN